MAEDQRQRDRQRRQQQRLYEEQVAIRQQLEEYRKKKERERGPVGSGSRKSSRGSRGNSLGSFGSFGSGGGSATAAATSRKVSIAAWSSASASRPEGWKRPPSLPPKRPDSASDANAKDRRRRTGSGGGVAAVSLGVGSTSTSTSASASASASASGHSSESACTANSHSTIRRRSEQRAGSGKRRPLAVIQRHCSSGHSRTKASPLSPFLDTNNETEALTLNCTPPTSYATSSSPTRDSSNVMGSSDCTEPPPPVRSIGERTSVSPLSSPEDDIDEDFLPNLNSSKVQIPVLSTAACSDKNDIGLVHGISTSSAIDTTTSPATTNGSKSVGRMYFEVDVNEDEDEHDGQKASRLQFDGLDNSPPLDKGRPNSNRRRESSMLFLPNSFELEKVGAEMEKGTPSISSLEVETPKIKDENSIDLVIAGGDVAELGSLCKMYYEEHAATRFLVGILRLEKNDIEDRMRILSNAYETKLLQNRNFLAELAKLRKENTILKQEADRKQKETDAIVSNLQTQMTSGLATAIQKTKSLQSELHVTREEKKKLERQLSELKVS